jgi:hypothetical protein
MKHLFVTYELAKSLKEKGFDGLSNIEELIIWYKKVNKL